MMDPISTKDLEEHVKYGNTVAEYALALRAAVKAYLKCVDIEYWDYRQNERSRLLTELNRVLGGDDAA